jgi:hypothetical protein
MSPLLPFATRQTVAMPALTLWPEWLPTFTHLDKRIENRGWPAPDRLIGQRIALHAGKRIGGGSGRKGIEWLAGTAAGEGWETDYLDGLLTFTRGEEVVRAPVVVGAVVGTAVLTGCRHSHEGPPLPWGMPGKYWWMLDEIEVLEEPIAARGRQGIWTWRRAAVRDARDDADRSMLDHLRREGEHDESLL